MIYNPENLVGKTITISYWKDFPGEYAGVVDIGDGKYKIVFEKFSDSEEDEIIWENEQPDSVDERGAYFTNLGDIGNFWMKILERENKKLEYNQEQQQTKQKQMKTTVKELAEKLDMEVAYINGFLQTLVKLGKAEVVGKVERPAGTRGKPSNIFEIADGIIGDGE